MLDVRNDPEIAEDIEAVLARFPLLLERRLQIAGTLSGGEQQMLAIGRALVARPRYAARRALARPRTQDRHPDFSHATRTQERGNTILLVSNARQALSVADHGYVLERGRIDLQRIGDEELLNMPEVQRTYLGQSAA